MIRAEEHLPNTPKQQLLWEALGDQPPPVWAHVPVMVNEKRQKLSKRRDKVALESYRDEGYLAEAMRNYLMLLGWAPPGDREIVPVGDRGRVPARGRQPVARVLRRQEAATRSTASTSGRMTVDEFTTGLRAVADRARGTGAVFAELGAPRCKSTRRTSRSGAEHGRLHLHGRAPVESEATGAR